MTSSDLSESKRQTIERVNPGISFELASAVGAGKLKTRIRTFLQLARVLVRSAKAHEESKQGEWFASSTKWGAVKRVGIGWRRNASFGGKRLDQ